MVLLPCGSLPMGTTPRRRRGDTMSTPAPLAGGLVIAGGLKKRPSRFAGVSGNLRCLRNGQCAGFQSEPNLGRGFS